MERKNLKKSSNIFFKNINSKYKLVPLNTRENYVGETKYYPAVSKEWKNKLYFFNTRNLKNLPLYDTVISNIIISYFDMYFKNNLLLKSNIPHKLKRLTLRKIYVSKPEIKHTNNKAIITLHVYNKTKLSFLKKIIRLIRVFIKYFYSNYYNMNYNKNLREFIKKVYSSWNIRKIFLKKVRVGKNNFSRRKFLRKNKIKYLFNIFSSSSEKYIKLKNNNLLHNNNWLLNLIYIKYRIYINIHKKIMKFKLYNLLILIRKYKFYFNLNKYKFEDIFLQKLGKLISKIYRKKIEFNIINLRSIGFNTDIFTDFLKNKLKKRRMKVLKTMDFILNKANILKINGIKERARNIKNVNFNLLENKYKNLNLNSIISNEYHLDEILKESYYNSFNTFIKNIDEYFYSIIKDTSLIWNIKDIFNKKIIFNNIKYKNTRGIRLEVKGRLTKRYRADRALFKIRRKGKLNNIDSSFKGLSGVTFRGYTNSNLDYSMSSSKRRIGSFAVKGWLSGK
jgi:hypothetical protein